MERIRSPFETYVNQTKAQAWPNHLEGRIDPRENGTLLGRNPE